MASVPQLATPIPVAWFTRPAMDVSQVSYDINSEAPDTRDKDRFAAARGRADLIERTDTLMRLLRR